ncbi:MAG: hypothetical protein R8K47_05850 [Mariprofundaceae bacterium]
MPWQPADRNRPSIEAAWERCRSLLANCEAAIRAGNWRHAREIAESYPQPLQELMHLAAARAPAHLDEDLALLRDVDARHRRVMGRLETMMRRINEDRESLGQGLIAITLQRRFLQSLDILKEESPAGRRAA